MAPVLTPPLDEDDEDQLATVLIDRIGIPLDEDALTPRASPEREAAPRLVSPAPLDLPTAFPDHRAEPDGSLDPGPPLPRATRHTPGPPDPSPTRTMERVLAGAFVVLGAAGLLMWFTP